ncbi:MAG: acylneuraminate cytidylyltransferase family protein [Planctomycetota bacterium]
MDVPQGYSNARCLAIIPARGGSKGVPRKNLASLGGRALIEHSIGHAIDATCVDAVIVTTDDAEIASVSRAAGAEVVTRPAELSGDLASSESALIHALDVRAQAGAADPESVVFLQATSPLRDRGDIDRAAAPVLSGEADSVFSACAFDGLIWDFEDGRPTPINYDPLQRQMRQRMPDRVLENGSIYVVRTSVLRETGCRLGGRVAVHRMPRERSLQIDDPGDLALCEAMLAVGSQPGRDAA